MFHHLQMLKHHIDHIRHTSKRILQNDSTYRARVVTGSIHRSRPTQTPPVKIDLCCVDVGDELFHVFEDGDGVFLEAFLGGLTLAVGVAAVGDQNDVGVGAPDVLF